MIKASLEIENMEKPIFFLLKTSHVKELCSLFRNKKFFYGLAARVCSS